MLTSLYFCFTSLVTGFYTEDEPVSEWIFRKITVPIDFQLKFLDVWAKWHGHHPHTNSKELIVKIDLIKIQQMYWATAIYKCIIIRIHNWMDPSKYFGNCSLILILVCNAAWQKVPSTAERTTKKSVVVNNSPINHFFLFSLYCFFNVSFIRLLWSFNWNLNQFKLCNDCLWGLLFQAFLLYCRLLITFDFFLKIVINYLCKWWKVESTVPHMDQDAEIASAIANDTGSKMPPNCNSLWRKWYLTPSLT